MDRRSFFANERVAHVSLKGQVEDKQLVAGAVRQVSVPVANLCSAPRGSRDAQLLMGAGFEVIEIVDGWSFGRSTRHGYVGYILDEMLAEEVSKPSHYVSARSSHIYPEPSIKVLENAALSFGSQLTVVDETNGFATLAGGGFVASQHIRSTANFLDDPAMTAIMLDGTPYLWGGDSAFGIDCSGLIQLCLFAAGKACPRDSDQQEAFFATEVSIEDGLKRGDLVFWRGHVGMMLNASEVIHANAYHMAVAIEPFEEAQNRIGKREFGAIASIKRP